MKKTRKGFTLVELLIVIVVIGILSAMMMMSSNEAVTTARANNIITNLRALKTAALAYYTDHMNETETFTADKVKEGMFSYLGKQAEIEDKANYTVEIKDGKWYVYYDTTKSNMMGTQDIRKKLLGRAKSIGLLDRSKSKGTYTDYSTGSDSGGKTYGGQFPALRVR